MTLNEDFLEWELAVPREITADALWQATAYRLALFVSDRCRQDLDRLAADPRVVYLVNQFDRALGSISANYAEAYSRSTVADRARFYEYALGSVREARDWCFKLRHALGEPFASELLALLTRITQLLTVTIVRERERGSRLKRRAKSES